MKTPVLGCFPGISPSGPETRQGPVPAMKDLFDQILAEVNHLQHRADAQIRGSLLGRAELHEAMLALEKASLSLRVLVQARNKIIQAYEELSRITM
jgi:flagellar hook-basal body complex protein FliE